MATDDKIRYERLQYNINREAAKVSALSSRKIDKYSSKRFRKINKNNLRQEKRQIEDAKVLKPNIQQLSIKCFISS